MRITFTHEGQTQVIEATPEFMEQAYPGVEYTAEPSAPAQTSAPSPQVCTPAQGLVALFALKQITDDDIKAAIANIPDPATRYTASIGFSRATEWHRESETMQQMATLLGLSESDLDDLYAYAVDVQV